MNANQKDSNKANNGKAKKVNYTPYRKAYGQAKSKLVARHKDEFKKLMGELLAKADK